MERFFRCLVVVSVTMFVSSSFGDDGPPLRSAFAERDITPAIGMEQPGGYGKSFHKVLHDPCKVRAVVFDNGTNRVAIVSVDALLVRRLLVLGARERIEEQCGIPADAILIHATHSHSSGPTGMIYPGEYDHASEEIQTLAYEKSSNANLDYVKRVEDAIVDAVVAADKEKAAVSFNVGVGVEPSVAFNRRFIMSNGLTYTHPRPGNPDIVKPAGPVDPEVGVIGVWNEEGELEGCIVNFVCHATTNPGGISANYIYYVEQIIRGAFGDDVVLVYLAGASGDVTQVENQTPYVGRKAEESARYVGGCVGAEAVKVLLREPKASSATVAAKSTVLRIPRRPPSKERVEKCGEMVAEGPSKVGATEWTFAKEILLLDARLEVEPIADAEVQAVQVGPAVFLTDPAEFFCQLGLDIKEGSPFPFTFPVSLANGCVGYVPTEEAFGPNGGGYETRLSSYSNLEITAGTQLVDAAVELSKQLQPDAVPTRPKVAPFAQNAWQYGSVPPELE